MFINIFLLLIFLICLIYLAIGLRRMEADMSASRRDLERLSRQEAELTGGIGTLEEMIGKEEEILRGIVVELDALKARKEEADVELQAAIDAPKQRIFVIDKSTLIHGKLWEVKVVNDALAKAGAPTAAEWADGRVCLIGSVTDRDARHRTESRYPPGQGYRIVGVERFRRA